MYRRILALLLIGGWMTLAQIDMLEDIDDPDSCMIANSRDVSDGSSPGLNPLRNIAHNIVESAARCDHAHAAIVFITPVHVVRESIADLRRASPLHKLFGIFLI